MAKGFEYRVDGGSAVDAGDSLSALIGSLAASTEYDIEVRKRNDAGTTSAWSSVVSQTTQSAGAIALDAVTVDDVTANGAFTISHTTSGSNRIIVVDVAQRSAFSGAGVSGVTYNGVALTEVSGSPVQATGTWARSCRYFLIAPDTGTHDVVVTIIGSPQDTVATVRTYTGVHQTVPFGTHATADGSSGTPSVNVSSASGELVIDTLAFRSSPTVDGSQTQRSNRAGNGPEIYGATSEEAGAGTVTMSWTGSSAEWTMIGSPLKPA